MPSSHTTALAFTFAALACFILHLRGRSSTVRGKKRGNGVSSSRLEELEKMFTLSKERLVKMKSAFIERMRYGLTTSSGPIAMIPSFVTRRPDGREKGSYWAIDFGGTNIRVTKFDLLGGGKVEKRAEVKAEIPEAIQRGNALQLFDFIAEKLKSGGAGHGEKVGFTFSYPVNQLSLSDGTLMRWTKRIDVEGVVGKNVTQLLREALARLGVDVEIVALVNDTVGTLASCAYDDSACMVGVILGTGSNASYAELASETKKWSGDKNGEIIINMEWGNFGDKFPGDLDLTEIDVVIDGNSLNRGQQLFEKQISGMYLGEITRLALVDLYYAQEVFHSAVFKQNKLFEPFTFDTACMSQIEKERIAGAAEWKTTLELLNTVLGIEEATPYDAQVIARVCSFVSRRSAQLSATGIASILEQMGSRARGCTVGVDGSLFKLYPGFKAEMENCLKNLGSSCTLKYSEDGSGKGAALIAAAMSS